MGLLLIFVNIILPIFIIIGIGAFLHSKFHFDLNTLAKINIYYLVPGLIFIRLYETKLSMNLFFSVFLFVIFYSLALYVVAAMTARLFRFNKSTNVAFTNGALYYNSGNYGVPVNDLVFRQDPFAMSIQVIILTLQNLLLYSFGIFSVRASKVGKLKALLDYLKMPITYSMVIGICLNVFNIPLPDFLYTTGTYIANALIGIALLTLGAQVAQLKFTKNLLAVYVSVVIRLMIGPILAYFIISFLNVDSMMAQALFIASAMPTSVTTSIIAQEYNNEPELAAQAVLASTFFSMITVTIVIYLAKLLFI